MAKTKHTCVQGDSYAYDFSSDAVTTFDNDWSGSWAIVDKLGAGRTTLASGPLGKSGDFTKLEMRIKPNDTNSLEIKSYYLIVEIKNTAIFFNKEIIQDVFIITDQGI